MVFPMVSPWGAAALIQAAVQALEPSKLSEKSDVVERGHGWGHGSLLMKMMRMMGTIEIYFS